jgi:hypothetical protein
MPHKKYVASHECLSVKRLNRHQYMGTVPTTVHPEYKHVEGKTMKALAWFGSKDVRMIDAPVPDITEEDDVIVQVTGTTICGSDLHL